MQSLHDSGIPEPNTEDPSLDGLNKGVSTDRNRAVSSAFRCFDSVIAILFPLVYGLMYGADTSWHWTALYSWLLFFICHPVDKEKIMCSLIIWSVISFVIWIVIYAVSHTSPFIYIGLYFLVNALILFAVALRSICERTDRNAYESI